MAMHGDICVNDRIIGTWSARRRDFNPGSGVAIYDCHTRSTDRNIQFEVVHTRSEGPLVLATKVLTEAQRILTKEPA